MHELDRYHEHSYSLVDIRFSRYLVPFYQPVKRKRGQSRYLGKVGTTRVGKYLPRPVGLEIPIPGEAALARVSTN